MSWFSIFNLRDITLSWISEFRPEASLVPFPTVLLTELVLITLVGMLSFGSEMICIDGCIVSPNLCCRSGLPSVTIERLAIGLKADNPGPLTLDWISVY